MLTKTAVVIFNVPQMHVSNKNTFWGGSAGSLEPAVPAVPTENDENCDMTGEDETGEEECQETDPIVEPEDSNLNAPLCDAIPTAP